MADISKIRVGGVDYDIKDQELTTEVSKKADSSSLAKVATSGSYNDLSNKPTIPSAVTESTVSGWGFTKNTGTYSKPSTGIPKSDLASAVQTSLGKADTALQSYTEQYKGTVTKVKINGSEKSPDSNGLVDLGTIEGGGSGEDIRYFTEFTVEDILEFVEQRHMPANNSELLTAMQNNKLVCIPYKDNANGFVVASYNEESSYIIFLNERVLYKLEIIPTQIFINPIYLSHNIVYSNNTHPWDELVYDNSTYIESNPATGIFSIRISEDLLIGSTIRFTTGENCSLTIAGRGADNLLWANGVMPTIEPGVTYELSLRTDYTDTRRAYAALTPFKSVE